MPYYVIDRYKVFLSHDRWLALNSAAMAHKDPQFQLGSMIAGDSRGREADRLRFHYLTQVYKRDAQAFWREWVEFDLRDREAQDNAWDLLYDYCALYGIGSLVDVRSEIQAIFDDYAGDSYTYPMGRFFGLQVLGGHTMASLLHLRPRPMLTIAIDTSQVVSATGTLEKFRLQFRHCTFLCSRHFSIVCTDAKHQTATAV